MLVSCGHKTLEQGMASLPFQNDQVFAAWECVKRYLFRFLV
ncbi:MULTISPECIES: hypothetical protein [Acetobacter]|nr:MULTISPECIES: hypothetical protein [Acetobacter]